MRLEATALLVPYKQAAVRSLMSYLRLYLCQLACAVFMYEVMMSNSIHCSCLLPCEIDLSTKVIIYVPGSCKEYILHYSLPLALDVERLGYYYIPT